MEKNKKPRPKSQQHNTKSRVNPHKSHHPRLHHANNNSIHRLVMIRPGRVWSVYCVTPLNYTQTEFYRALTSSGSTSNNGSRSSIDQLDSGPPKEQRTHGIVFLLHGVGGSAWVWQHQIVYLAQQGYTVIVPELPGHGNSPAYSSSRAYEFTELSVDCLHLFDNYSDARNDTNVLIGHSYGTSLVSYIAHERLVRVHRLVLLSGGAPCPLGHTCGFFNLPICILACIMPCVQRRFQREAFAKQSRVSPQSQVASFYVPSRVLKSIMLGQIWSEGDEAYHEAITTPTLLLYGLEDRLVDQEEESSMQATLPIAWLRCIESAGHMLMMESPDSVNRYIHTFIDQRMDEGHYQVEKISKALLRKCEQTAAVVTSNANQSPTAAGGSQTNHYNNNDNDNQQKFDNPSFQGHDVSVHHVIGTENVSIQLHDPPGRALRHAVSFANESSNQRKMRANFGSMRLPRVSVVRSGGTGPNSTRNSPVASRRNKVMPPLLSRRSSAARRHDP